MRKILSIVAIVAIAVFMLTGVLEIKFHGDKLSDIPRNIVLAGSSKSTWVKIRNTGVHWKRNGEQWLVKDNAQKLELSLGYVEKDSQSLLDTVATSAADPEVIALQAELLIKSLRRASDVITHAPADVLASARGSAEQSFSTAHNALAKLSEAREERQALNERLAELSSELNDQLGDVAPSKENTEEAQPVVAGSQDKKEETVESESKEETRDFPAVPLTF
jgi:hypothetical protein